MKTFEQIFREMFNEIYKSPEGWPDNLSITEVHNRAAKEYAKQWIDEASKIGKEYPYGESITESILDIKNQIEAQ